MGSQGSVNREMDMKTARVRAREGNGKDKRKEGRVRSEHGGVLFLHLMCLALRWLCCIPTLLTI